MDMHCGDAPPDPIKIMEASRSTVPRRAKLAPSLTSCEEKFMLKVDKAHKDRTYVWHGCSNSGGGGNAV